MNTAESRQASGTVQLSPMKNRTWRSGRSRNGIARISFESIFALANRRFEPLMTFGFETWSRIALRAAPLSMSDSVGLSRIRSAIDWAVCCEAFTLAWRRARWAYSRWLVSCWESQRY